ncbi:lipopolysaccharide biosynthesis RfbU-related protein [hydrothermal vent metagenome]|uniref:Lipopolysaccharide biosynthesis RfbU-related protein n=1 Tax=hydrothermal vent metagenome TaxID=652676 RepID=A0A1W1E7W6_9ZZZZ
MRNIIVYVGGFKFPEQNASAVRVRENAWLLHSLGYETVLVGKLPEYNGNVTYKIKVDSFDAYDIRHPFPDCRYSLYTTSIKSIEDIVAHYGLNKIAMIIAYNYPAIALHKLVVFGKKNNIAVAADITEWYGWEGWRLDRNLKRLFDTQFRIRYVAKKAGNIIVASQYMRQFYEGYNSVIWPFCVHTELERWQFSKEYTSNTICTFVYTGSPGIGMSKDRLNLLIEAFNVLHDENISFRYIIQGITKEQYLNTFRSHRSILNKMDKSIVFKGRVPHKEALETLQKADYSLFIRPNNRVSHAGFPTKVMEAFTVGVPTVTNDTSDIASYVRDDENGFIIPDITLESIVKTLKKAIHLPENRRKEIRENCRKENPFALKRFQEQVQHFIMNARNSI